jgi:glycosyltransferase involved in cell wall biosynthesis
MRPAGFSAQPDDRLKDLWIVIPAYNEGPVLESVVRRILTLYPNVVVVDDGSADETRQIAKRTGAHVLRHSINLGQGAALQTGIDYALDQGARCIVTFDADGQMDENDIGKMCEPIIRGEVDIVLGSRFLLSRQDSVPPIRRRLLRCAAFFTRLSTGLRLTDTHNGFRTMSREAALKLHILLNGMAHASEIIEAIAHLHLRYMELPVSIRYTPYSLAKGQRGWNSIDILWDLFLR